LVHKVDSKRRENTSNDVEGEPPRTTLIPLDEVNPFQITSKLPRSHEGTYNINNNSIA